MQTEHLSSESRLVRTPADKARVLRSRAQALAQETERQVTTGPTLQVVEFSLSGERYAIETASVREVCMLRELTLLPGTPPFVLGIINLRGQILPVIDLRRILDLPTQERSELNRVIIARTQDLAVGIYTDQILATRELPAQEVGPLPTTLATTAVRYLKGITTDRVVLLDIDRVLIETRLGAPEDRAATRDGTRS